MASKVYFEDNTLKVIDNANHFIEKALLECAAELTSRTIRNSRVDTGETKNSWRSIVERDGSGFVATIGSDKENAIWEEFGTGEFALEGNGRKGGWRYKDIEGNWHFTYGKKPSRAFWKAYTAKKKWIINHLQESLKGL